MSEDEVDRIMHGAVEVLRDMRKQIPSQGSAPVVNVYKFIYGPEYIVPVVGTTRNESIEVVYVGFNEDKRAVSIMVSHFGLAARVSDNLSETTLPN